MRAAAIAVLFAVSTAQLRLPEFEARSRHLLLTINTKPAAAGAIYDVLVRDLDSGQALIEQHTELPVGGEVDLSSDAGEPQVTARIVPKIDRLLAVVTLTSNGEVIDQIAASWSYKPPYV